MSVPRVSKDVPSMCPLQRYHYKLALYQGMGPQEVRAGFHQGVHSKVRQRSTKGSIRNSTKMSAYRANKRVSKMFTWRSIEGSTKMSIWKFVVRSTTSSIGRSTLSLPWSRTLDWNLSKAKISLQ